MNLFFGFFSVVVVDSIDTLHPVSTNFTTLGKSKTSFIRGQISGHEKENSLGPIEKQKIYAQVIEKIIVEEILQKFEDLRHKYEDEVAHLRYEYEEFLIQHHASVQVLQEERDKILPEYQELRNKRNKIDKEIEELGDQRDQLFDELDGQTDHRYEELDGQINQLYKESDKLRTELYELRDTYRKIRTEIENLRNARDVYVDDFHNKVATLNGQIDQLRSERNKELSERLNSEVDQLIELIDKVISEMPVGSQDNITDEVIDAVKGLRSN